jgi:hypothetical protein
MKLKIIETSSMLLPDGSMLEQIKSLGEVYFAYYDGKRVRRIKEKEADGKLYKPIDNPLVATDTVIFASDVGKYGDIESLRQEIQDFIHKYVDVSPDFERLSSYYVLLSWVYDRFQVLPYLRVIGEPGTGKSRYLEVMRSICYKSIKVSGAISVASIFRLLEEFAGTLILEEADLPTKSDEYQSAVKILNCGYERDNPVIRQEQTRRGYISVPYRVFSPKIIATRKRFEDRALETRMLTEKMTKMSRREEISLNLPASFGEDALSLRNKFLSFRFRNFHKIEPSPVYAQSGIEPRILQIVSPLLDIMPDGEKSKLIEWAKDYTQQLIIERGASVEGAVVRALFELMHTDEELSVKNITNKVNENYTEPSDKLSLRRVGGMLANLGLSKRRGGVKGNYVIDTRTSAKTLELLQKQYDIEASELLESRGEAS